MKLRLSTESSQTLFLAAVMGLVMFVVFPSMFAGFRGGDDALWVNDISHRNSLTSIFDPWLKTENPYRNTYYIPGQSALFYLFDVLFHQRAAQAMRVLILLAHLCSGLLLTQMLSFLLKDDGALGHRMAVWSGALFLLYPPNIQTVTWISAGLSHVLSSTLILGAMFFWKQSLDPKGIPKKNVQWGASVLFGIAALLTKESAAVLPFLLAAVSLSQKKRGDKGAVTCAWIDRLLLSQLFLLLAIFFAVVIQITLYHDGSIAHRWGGIHLLWAPVRAVGLLAQFIIPVRQPVLLKLFSWTVTVVVMLLITWRRRSAPSLAMMSWLGLLCILPFSISNYNPYHTLNRYLYLPSLWLMSFCVMMCERGELLGFPKRIARMLPGARPVVLVLFGVVSCYWVWSHRWVR